MAPIQRLLRDPCITTVTPARFTSATTLTHGCRCTAWHALEVVDVKETDTVLVLGLGPIGMLSAYLARTICNAKRVIAVDPQAYRLEMALRNIPGVECINATTQDVVKTVQSICPGGPDVSIDAAAFRYARGVLHTAMRAVGMETDTSGEYQRCVLLAGRRTV